jgi:5-methylcytosine-specific restriction endonuclease McrA
MTKRNGGRWTEARYRSFIRSALRGAFRKWPPKFDVLKSAANGKSINTATGRLAMHYTCASCKGTFPLKEVQVDHIKPIVDVKKGFVSWDSFINNLYCEANNLQVLCKDPCHKEKTKLERIANGKRKAR